MLDLPEVTLLSIDCTPNVRRTLGAMIMSMRQARFKKAVLVTDWSMGEIVALAKSRGIEVMHHVSGSRADHELDMIERTPDYFSTPFVLYQEWDACVMNISAWDEQFLKCDYIGAMWPDHQDPGFPRVSDHNRVGNGGFSLKSQHFCKLAARFMDRSDKRCAISDSWMCLTMREKMMKNGIRYAPWQLAERFACEETFYSGQFGLHGDQTIKMNNLNWDFGWLL